MKHFAQGLAVKSKTDASDPVVLARYGALVKPPAWEPPPPEITELKALITRLEAIEGTMRRELNRIEKTTITGVPTAVRESLEKSVSFLKEEKGRLEKTFHEHIDQHPTLKQDRHLLESIPAVGPKTAWRMLTLLRGRTFTRAPQAAAYVGLVPIEHQSGTSVLKRPRLSKAGDARLRAALYMAAVVASNTLPTTIRLNTLDNKDGIYASSGSIFGHKCPILYGMKGREFVRRVQRYAKANGILCSWRPDTGKGSHGTLTLGHRRTIVRNPKDDLKTGTYHSMLKQLGLAERELF